MRGIRFRRGRDPSPRFRRDGRVRKVQQRALRTAGNEGGGATGRVLESDGFDSTAKLSILQIKLLNNVISNGTNGSFFFLLL